MDVEEIYTKIKDKNAVALFTDIELRLALRTPDAKVNHKRDQLGMGLNGHIGFIEIYGSRDWTIEQYFQQSRRTRLSVLEIIHAAVERFKYSVDGVV